MDLKTSKKRKKRGASNTRPTDLLDEIVTEILLRLPVKSLVRFKSACRTWRATISSQFFIRAQLEHSSASTRRGPSFLISPHTLDRVIQGEIWPTTFSTHLSFYQWRPDGDSKAVAFVYDTDLSGEFSMVCCFAHCDGLVLAPTDTKLYLFNPATRDVIALANDVLQQGGYYHSAAGLGLDPRTCKYKVVRSFYHSLDARRNIYHMGMEVFTAGESGGAWREMVTDPLYPVDRWQTAVTVKGFMVWHMDKGHHEQPPRGLLRLSLADEFRVVELPDSLDPAFDDTFMLDVVHGDELWLTSRTSEVPPPGTVTIWAMSSRDDYSRWERRYTIHVSDVCHPMRLLPDGGGLVPRKGYGLYRYDLATSELTGAAGQPSSIFRRMELPAPPCGAGRSLSPFHAASCAGALRRWVPLHK